MLPRPSCCSCLISTKATDAGKLLMRSSQHMTPANQQGRTPAHLHADAVRPPENGATGPHQEREPPGRPSKAPGCSSRSHNPDLQWTQSAPPTAVACAAEHRCSWRACLHPPCMTQCTVNVSQRAEEVAMATMLRKFEKGANGPVGRQAWKFWKSTCKCKDLIIAVGQLLKWQIISPLFAALGMFEGFL